MTFRVPSARHGLEVFHAIVEGVLVQVVHDHVRGEHDAVVFLVDQAVQRVVRAAAGRTLPFPFQTQR
jgi:hypothetical protein